MPPKQGIKQTHDFFSSFCLFVCLVWYQEVQGCVVEKTTVFSLSNTWVKIEMWHSTGKNAITKKGKLRYHHKSAPLLIPVVWVWALAWVLFCVVLCSRVRCFTLTELLLRRSINGYWKTVEETSKNAPGLPVIDKPSTHITCHTALYATETTKISPNSYKYRPGGP